MINRWCFALLMAFLAGCSTEPRGELTPAQSRILGELEMIDLDHPEFKEERAGPIVDVHVHTFNARYLPIREIGMGKRDAHPAAGLVPGALVEAFAAILVARTEMDGPPGAAEAASPDRFGPESRIDTDLERIATREGTSPEALRQEEAIRALDKILSENDPERIRTEGMRPAEAPTASEMSALQRLMPFNEPSFLKMLKMKDGPKEALYRAVHGMPERRPLFRVTHMMDLAPVYDQEPASGTLLDFQTEQVPRMERFQNQSNGSIVYFVAYNPYRDHWPKGEGRRGDALAIVKDAIKNRGAYGVKVYPPSGYRPIGNEIKPREDPLLTRAPGKQWDARYTDADGCPIPDKEFDARLRELLDWCADNDVPVFAHCHTGEFEPRKGYGKHHAHPRWWEMYLNDAKRRGKELRLCFAHAGGGSFWFGVGDDQDWGETVARLCRQHRFVYCEFGIHDEVVDADNRARFVEILSRELAKPTRAGQYPLAGKLMYGTDWYMPNRGDRREYLQGFERMFLHPKLREHYAAFFHRNALEYLAVEARLASTSIDVPQPPSNVAEKLRELMTRPTP